MVNEGSIPSISITVRLLTVPTFEIIARKGSLSVFDWREDQTINTILIGYAKINSSRVF